jgi:diguanylate cyclase (GGDEF)-like protein
MLAKFQSSLTAKLFVTSFISTHIPLVSALIYYVYNRHLDPRTMAALLISATILGTAICLGALWSLLQPLRQLRVAIVKFRRSRVTSDFHSARRDEIGLIINAFSNLTNELARTIATLEHQATFDVVTGLRNRRWLVDSAPPVISRAQREEISLTVVVLDLDHFKSINDRFGHEIGDNALCATGSVILSCIRPYDYAARIGGEEFAIMLPGCDKAAAMAIADRIRTQLASLLVLPDNAPLTASFGVYESNPKEETLSLMLRMADANLYKAKRAGRNLVIGTSNNSIEQQRRAERTGK